MRACVSACVCAWVFTRSQASDVDQVLAAPDRRAHQSTLCARLWVRVRDRVRVRVGLVLEHALCPPVGRAGEARARGGEVRLGEVRGGKGQRKGGPGEVGGGPGEVGGEGEGRARDQVRLSPISESGQVESTDLRVHVYVESCMYMYMYMYMIRPTCVAKYLTGHQPSSCNNSTAVPR